MKNNIIILRLRLAPVFLFFSFMDSNAQDGFGIWSGTISYHIKFTALLHNYERQIDVHFTDNKGTGTVVENGEFRISSLFCKSSCSGSGAAELHDVIVDKLNSTYSIYAISPRSTCIQTGPYCDEPTKDNGIFDLLVLEKHLGTNPNFLVGSETKVDDFPGDPGNSKATTTITWNLVRSMDDELIVTPSDYDNWKPEPGKDELTKGSVMNISLKVLGKNGRSPSVKAKSFELRLSNTSKEPGITLNAPLTPSPNQLPDLRLLPPAIAESMNEDQFITIPCKDGLTGKVSIGSYDGGGWTTLTAEAILEDGTHLQGQLIVSGGETEIPIPKRNSGTKIATSWLTANGDPREIDDKETSAGNTWNGDGLTAYEEYRGVISEGQFKRLDPNEKELGAWVKRADFALFSEGLSWFENASSFKVIPFYENEIGKDRRLNKNASSAHIYDQYVLKLVKGIIGKKGVVGKTFGGPEIPKNIEVIKIDYDKMAQQQVETELSARNANVQLPFTLKDLLAKNVSHELAHGVNVGHHGESEVVSIDKTFGADPRIHIFLPYSSSETTDRPYNIEGIIGGSESHNQESGDVFCIMNYNPSYSWAFREGNNTLAFYRVPLLYVGNIMCNSKEGTEFNKKDINGHNNYFGDAAVGNCLSQIKLKD